LRLQKLSPAHKMLKLRCKSSGGPPVRLLHVRVVLLIYDGISRWHDSSYSEHESRVIVCIFVRVIHCENHKKPLSSLNIFTP
jgi:hypothetical protein